MKKVTTFIIILISLIFSSCGEYLLRCRKVNKTKLQYFDYRLFQGTEAWGLAKAVQDGRTLSMAYIVKKKPYLINYQDPVHGTTLLMQTVLHEDYRSFKKLLKLGADVNIADSVFGETALIQACSSSLFPPKYALDLLKYGADPNFLTLGGSKRPELKFTPLRVSCRTGHDLELIKALIEDYGADINEEFLLNWILDTPLGNALIQRNYKIAYYLIQKGADINKPLYNRYQKIMKDSVMVEIVSPMFIRQILDESYTSKNVIHPENKSYRDSIMMYLDKLGK